jgi:small subunit ribosomal protein S20
MTHTSSSAKDLRRIKKRTTRNKGLRSSLRTSVKKARQSIDDGSDDTAIKIKEAIRTLDKMVTKGIISSNTASRKKSRLVKHHNAVLKGVSPAEIKPKKIAEKPPETVDTSDSSKQ